MTVSGPDKSTVHNSPQRRPAVAASSWCRRRLVLALVAGVLVSGSGCTDQDRGADVPGPSGTGSSAPTTGTELVVVGTDGSGARVRWRLTCEPPGGDHPDPEAACRVLAEAGDRALPPVRKDRVCTQVYGGPETATVSGTWRGQPVVSSFSRTDGCQIARWDALAALLPTTGN